MQRLAKGAGGEHMAAWLHVDGRAWGSAATKCIQAARHALIPWQLVQVISFPGPMVYWAKLDLGE